MARYPWLCMALVGLSLSLPDLTPTTARAGEGLRGARLGINLSAPADYNTELPFVDVFRMSRKWISQRQGAGFGKGPALDLDEHGWVKRLEPGCSAETFLCTIRGGHYPAGTYTVFYDGEGKLGVGGAATVASSRKGQMLIKVAPAKGGFVLRLLETNPSNYVKNIRVIMPGFAKTYRENPWHPKFLERWKGMACLRFMDLMMTNNSTISTWAERPTFKDATFSIKGVPLEMLIDLANRMKIDPWFCMPHRADDEYVRNFATMVKEKLDPKLKPWIEYSNEVWNGMFKQHAYAAEQGKKLGFKGKPWEAAWRYTAHRSVQVFRIWEEVFGGHQRLVRVLPSQAANAGVSREIVTFRGAYKHADVLAIAPYLSLNVSPKSTPSASEVAGWTADQALDYLESKSFPQVVKWIRDSKAVAAKHRLKLVAYEGGQHMLGIQGVENNDAVTKVLQAANASPRLGKIYERYFDTWEKAGGDLFCCFSSVSAWTKWGSWGLLQYYDDDPANYPRFLAVMRWAHSHGQPVRVPR